jgi:hypothetical protein
MQNRLKNQLNFAENRLKIVEKNDQKSRLNLSSLNNEVKNESETSWEAFYENFRQFIELNYHCKYKMLITSLNCLTNCKTFNPHLSKFILKRSAAP